MSAVAYLAGVLCGDGWESPKDIGLRVKDRDFADTFAVALEIVTGHRARPRLERSYWTVRAKRDSQNLKGFKPTTKEEMAYWLRGLFDSEGNVQMVKVPNYPDSWIRRVALYSTEPSTIKRAGIYLDSLEIPSRVRLRKPTKGHLGNLPVYELSLICSADNFRKFAWLVGSSIERKRSALLRMVLSYKPDLSASCRNAQKIGAANRKRKTIDTKLPGVLKGIRDFLERGIKPTQKVCGSIPGFFSICRYFRQAELVDMATR